MQQELTTILIPVKPHIRKYIAYKFRAYKFICVTKKHIIGRKLYDLLLNSKNIRWGGYKVNKQECAEFAISYNQLIYRVGPTLRHEAILDFNRFVEELFYNDLFEYIELNETGKKVKHVIHDFCEKLNLFEDDISYQTLVKAHQRYMDSISFSEELKIAKQEYFFFDLKRIKNKTRYRSKPIVRVS